MLALSAPSNTNCLAPPNRTSRGGGVGVGKLRLPLSLVGGGAAGRTGAGEIDTGAGERFVAGGSGAGAGGRSVEGSTCTDGSEGAPPGEGSSARAARGPDATTAPTRSSLASKERKLFISLLSHGRFVSSVFISRPHPLRRARKKVSRADSFRGAEERRDLGDAHPTARDGERGKRARQEGELRGVLEIGEQDGGEPDACGAKPPQDQDPLRLGQPRARAGIHRCRRWPLFVDQPIGRRAAKIEVEQEPVRVGRGGARFIEVVRREKIERLAEKTPEALEVLGAVLADDEAKAGLGR